jgi:hypothetical protein
MTASKNATHTMYPTEEFLRVRQLYRHACTWSIALDRDDPAGGIIARLRDAVPGVSDAELYLGLRSALVDLEPLREVARDICGRHDNLDDDDPRAGWFYALLHYVDALGDAVDSLDPDEDELTEFPGGDLRYLNSR